MRDPTPFPIRALPAPLRDFVTEGAEAFPCAPEMLALPELASCAGAIGNTREAEAWPGFTQPGSLWAVVIAETGALKTPTLRAATRPLATLQDAANTKYQAELAEYAAAGDKSKPARS